MYKCIYVYIFVYVSKYIYIQIYILAYMYRHTCIYTLDDTDTTESAYTLHTNSVDDLGSHLQCG